MWQYKVVLLDDAFLAHNVEEQLNSSGESGWENYAVILTKYGWILFFRRKI